MRSKFFIVAAAMTALSDVPTLQAQSAGDALQVELVAVRALLSHRNTTGNVTIDSLQGPSHAAPGSATAERRRPTQRSADLARLLNATVRTYGDVHQCDAKQHCALVGTGSHLILSSPSIQGDSADITATLFQPGPGARRPVDYETVQFTLQRRTSGWVVVREVQLGIS
jgi:hypothetical protein